MSLSRACSDQFEPINPNKDVIFEIVIATCFAHLGEKAPE